LSPRVAAGTALVLLLLPGVGRAQPQVPPRDVGRIYWELVPTTEIFVRLIPEDPGGKPPLLYLIFQAFFPGRAQRDPYSGQPRWPSGTPARLVVTAQPFPRTVIRELSLQLVVDGKTLDLTAPTSRYRNLPCLVASDDCVPNAVEAELDASFLRSLVTARAVEGKALGFPIRLVAADQRALGEFVARIGLSEDALRRKQAGGRHEPRAMGPWLASGGGGLRLLQ
jgi:hypothetical protein